MNAKDMELIRKMLKKQAKLDNAIMAEYGLTEINKDNLMMAILDEVLNTGKYECSAGYIESIQQYARDIDCYEIFIESLEYSKTGERK